jgi:hypothetical protein
MGDKLRIVVGCDDAGRQYKPQYKEALKQDLQSDERVSDVSDVGVVPMTPRPIRTSRWRPPGWWPRARPTGPCSSAGPGWAWRSARTRLGAAGGDR